MDVAEITFQVQELHATHKEIASVLQQRYPGTSGISERSVRRFCRANHISRRAGTRVPDEALDTEVARCIESVGHRYGRKTMQGLLVARGVRVNEVRVGQSLRRVAPAAQRLRSGLAHRLMNPVPYTATHFGHKLHLDQNEKLIHYGVTHVLAIDGYSRKVVGFITIQVKNAVEIYRLLFHPILLHSGLWDQVRTDGGREFDLVLAVQEFLSPLRQNTTKPPYRRTQSIHNLRAERYWCFLNQRVNYPLKAILCALERDQAFDLDDGLQQFCVSWVTMQVASCGAVQLAAAWNNHRIPGRLGGIPSVLQRRTDATVTLNNGTVPTVNDAVHMFQQAGGALTLPTTFGLDLLEDRIDLQRERQRLFVEHYDITDLFSSVVHGRSDRLRAAINAAYNLTVYLSVQVQAI